MGSHATINHVEQRGASSTTQCHKNSQEMYGWLTMIFGENYNIKIGRLFLNWVTIASTSTSCSKDYTCRRSSIEQEEVGQNIPYHATINHVEYNTVPR